LLYLLLVPPSICFLSMASRPSRRGKSRPASAGGLRSPGFRVKVWWGGAQAVAVASSPIKYPRLQPRLGGDAEKLVGVVWFSRTSFGCGDLQIAKELHQWLFLLLHLRDRCGLLDPFGDFPYATNKVKPALGGAAAAARRRHGLEVEDEGHLKNFVVIFVFVEVLCTIRCFF
jgi:hypothetical protein